MKIYDIIVNATDNETGVNTISLVEHPAVEVGFLKFEKDDKIELKFDDEKQIITGVAMLADTPIYRYNTQFGEHYVIFSKKTIENIIEKFSKFGMQNFVNIEHSEVNYVEGIYMIESYITNKERGISPIEFDVPDGSWIVSYKVNNSNLWKDIKDGKVLGFSVEGLFKYGDSIDDDMINLDEYLK